MTTERDQFMQTIIEHPKEDMPRLVFADWLEEHGGEPERAEFIRLQVEMAGMVERKTDWFRFDVETSCYECIKWSKPCRYHKLKKQAEALLDSREKQWTRFGFYIPFSFQKEFVRGFVGKLSHVRYEWWHKEADDIRKRLPIEKVELCTNPDISLQFDQNPNWVKVSLLHPKTKKCEVFQNVEAIRVRDTSCNHLQEIVKELLAHRWPGIEFDLFCLDVLRFGSISIGQ